MELFIIIVAALILWRPIFAAIIWLTLAPVIATTYIIFKSTGK